MAGIDVSRSYEWWAEAATTHEANNGHPVTVADIRQLDLPEFPQGVDFVIGSPPCTQFSFSNRGGNGDIADGLKDIQKFLEVVEHVRPRAWAMENVPRVAGLLRKELRPGGSLEQFSSLVKVIEVVDASDFGVPQRRRRMIAGDFDWETLLSYRGLVPTPTLGDVINGLASGDADPVFGWPTSVVTDHLMEQHLDPEELRMNREQKRYHRVYNRMPFPEPLDRTSRTVTALCTRVSRESLVVQDGESFRRLTVRERATLQSFPVAFQFHGKTHSSRVKMVGNAIPPLLTFFIGHAMLGTPAQDLRLPSHPPALSTPISSAVPPLPRRSFSASRKFAAAIPGLRFGSGMRFELANSPGPSETTWGVSFFYGQSKSVLTAPLNEQFLLRLVRQSEVPSEWVDKVRVELANCLADLPNDPQELQHRWLKSDMQRGPYRLVDLLGQLAETAETWLPQSEAARLDPALAALVGVDLEQIEKDRSLRKLKSYGRVVVSGACVGALFNSHATLARPWALLGTS